MASTLAACSNTVCRDEMSIKGNLQHCNVNLNMRHKKSMKNSQLSSLTKSNRCAGMQLKIPLHETNKLATILSYTQMFYHKLYPNSAFVLTSSSITNL